jgi:hypothetical protein
MTESISVRGKNRQTCTKCRKSHMRTIWYTMEGKTERKALCLECDHIQPVQKMDKRVYSMFAPEDADCLRSIIRLSDGIIDCDMGGNQPLVRHGLTELRQRINGIPAHLRRKLEL